MQPQYWDVCTSRKDGRDTMLETVAENCAEDDARLIAAAPELLAALQDFLRAEESARHGFGPNQIAHIERAMSSARAAIKRATEGGK